MKTFRSFGVRELLALNSMKASHISIRVVKLASQAGLHVSQSTVQRVLVLADSFIRAIRAIRAFLGAKEGKSDCRWQPKALFVCLCVYVWSSSSKTKASRPTGQLKVAQANPSLA